MKMKLDHFFILVEPEAKVSSRLIELGLEESYSRVHPGQGTANRCFKFSNSMMELLWLHDEEEANTGPGKGLKISDRLTNKDASPFGLVFIRDSNHQQSSSCEKPFSGWSYQPDYFPAPNAFHVGSNSGELVEPLCIYVPFIEPKDKVVEIGDLKSISHIHVTVPTAHLSEVMLSVGQIDGLSVECGEEHLMEIVFDQKMLGITHDLRPNLPLIIHR